MKNSTKKQLIVIIACLILSLLIGFFLPFITNRDTNIVSAHSNEKSILDQDIVGYSKEKQIYYKLYNEGKLVGVVYDKAKIDELIAEEYKKYESKFPGSKLGLGEDLYLSREESFTLFENIDEQIVKYLADNDLLAIRATAVEFSTEEGVYDIIYVSDIDLFYEARDTFLANFISDESLAILRNDESVDSPVNFGSVDMNLTIQEQMSYRESFAYPDDIFTTFEEIYDYLCYGRNTERNIYTTRAGDTLQGVAYWFGSMSTKQLMMINRDVIFDENQIISEGMKLNVTYYSSPITVVVTKQKLTQEVIMPGTPEYREDETLASGARRTISEEVNGLKNVLYEEVWINGVLQSGEALSEKVVQEPVNAVIAVGTMKMPDYGTGNFMWPVDSPKITCMWGCYAGHQGTDIVSTYERYGNIYAADTGIVSVVSYDSISGNYIMIDHQNGFISYYGHCNATYVEPGQTVQRGEVIGQIGMTGYATGPHVHFNFFVDGSRVNVCNYMDCASLPGGY